MREGAFKKSLLIGLTFLIAMMLLILPLPSWITWFRPAWVFMVLIFWMVAIPDRMGIGIAWVIGLLIDLLTGTLFGQHALVLACIAYFVIKFQVQIRSFPLWQQILLIMGMTMVYLALQYWMLALAGTSPDTDKYWLPVLTTTLIWPWVYILLKDFQHRFEII